MNPPSEGEQREWARWDAFVHAPNPDALFDELRDREVTFQRALEDTDDGLRSFEVRDNNGYILCFGKVREGS